MATAATATLGADDPFVGTWVLAVAKSTLPAAGPAALSQTVVITDGGDGKTLTATITAQERPLAGTPTVMVFDRE